MSRCSYIFYIFCFYTIFSIFEAKIFFIVFITEEYFTFKSRKYSIEAEYIENVRTPTHKSCKTLDLVPRSPRDDLYIRYGNESRIHEFLSKHPNRITTWTEDILRSNDIVNNINKPVINRGITLTW